VTFADALFAHKTALDRSGGLDGIRSSDLIQSAIARPYMGYCRSIEKKSAALIESVAKNHGFVDGNKRTALLLAQLFLQRSGYEMTALPGDTEATPADMVEDVVTRKLVPAQLLQWLKDRIRRHCV
jgi:death-on-curing protein